MSYNQGLGEQLAKSGSAFSAFWQNTPVASTYGACQLWNPANSGIKLVVRSLIPYYGGTASFPFCLLPDSVQRTGTTVNGDNCLIGGAVSKALNIWQNLSTIPTTVNTLGVGTANATGPATTIPQFVKDVPYIIPPGFGITIASYLANNGIGCTAIWTEEAL